MGITLDEAQTKLAKSISELAKLFERFHGAADWVDALDVDQERSRVTLRTKVYGLEQEDYEYFCWHAFAIPPCSRDANAKQLAAPLRYFLPRIAADISNCEILLGRQVVLRKNAARRSPPLTERHFATCLEAAGWRRWPASDQAGIEFWLQAHLEFRALESSQSGCSVWELRAAALLLAQTGFDVGGELRQLLQCDRLVGAIAIARLINNDYASLLETGWPPDWRYYREWVDSEVDPIVARQYISAILGREARAAIHSAFFLFNDETVSTILSGAIDHAQHCVEFGERLPGTPLAEAISRSDLPSGP